MDLSVRPETIKLLEDNIGKTLSDTNHSRILYDPPPRIMEIKAKINKWDLNKILVINIVKAHASLIEIGRYDRLTHSLFSPPLILHLPT